MIENGFILGETQIFAAEFNRDDFFIGQSGEKNQRRIGCCAVTAR